MSLKEKPRRVLMIEGLGEGDQQVLSRCMSEENFNASKMKKVVDWWE